MADAAAGVPDDAFVEGIVKTGEECEAKLVAPDAMALAGAVELARACGAQVGSGHHYRMRDIYLDTEDGWLARAGIGLRVRRVGRREIFTAKTRRSAPGRLTRRIEWEEEHSAGRFRPPGPLPRGRLASWLKRSRGPTSLSCLIELDHERRQHDAWLPGGARAKLCLDRVQVAGRQPPPEWCEIEMELVDGPSRALKRFARRFESASGWRRDGLSKLERALRLAGVSEPPPPDPRSHRIRARDRLAEAAWQVLRLRFAEFRWNEPGARAGLDPDYLHDMRVAARRMRAALRIFRGALPPDFVERADRELRHFFANMGRVRDLDVGLSLLRARIPEDDASGAAAWIERLERRRKRAWNRMLRDFVSPRYDRFLSFMEGALASDPPTGAAAPRAGHRVGDHAPKILRRAFRKALDSAFAIDAGAAEADFHAVRIRFKKLRYAVEFFADLRPRATRKLGAELAEIQDVLGEFQDEVVLRTLLRQGGNRGLSRNLIAARERMEQQIERRIADRQRDFLRLRKRLRLKSFRKLMDKINGRK